MILDPALPLIRALKSLLHLLLTLPRFLAKLLVGSVTWLHQRAYQPIAEYWVETWVGFWEESIKSLVRECFQTWVRTVNWICRALVETVERFRNCNKEGKDVATRWDFAAWEAWRPSTFNWVIQNHQAESGDASSPIENNQRETPRDRCTGEQHTQRRTGSVVSELNLKLERGWNIVKDRLKHSPSGNSQPLPSFSELLKSISGPPGTSRRGWVEDLHIALEIAITRFFSCTKWLIKKLFFLRLSGFQGGRRERKSIFTRASQECKQQTGRTSQIRFSTLRSARSAGAINSKTFANSYATRSKSNVAKQHVSDDGYVLEDHDVITDDGFILTLHRLPRPQSQDAVFFQHGILDTSISWCSNGVTGSLAYHAYEAGYDVWLGNCRASPPRRHQDPSLPSHEYWNYSLNELGQKDVGAQLEHIHKTKCQELESPRQTIVRWKTEDHEDDLLASHSPEKCKEDSLLETISSLRCCQSMGNLEVAAPEMPGDCSDHEERNSPRDLHTSLRANSDIYSPSNEKSHKKHGTDRRQTKQKSRMRGPTRLQGKERTHLSAEEIIDGYHSFPSGEDNNEHDSQGSSSDCSASQPEPPYKLQAIGHSLGGAALLIHLVMSRRKQIPHRLHKLVLLSPAGFHHEFPPLAYPFIYFLPFVEFVWRRILRLKGFGIMIPGRYSRIAVYKVLQDIQRFPGLRSALNLIMHLLLGGDKSPWDSAMQLPHYQDDGMPGISLHTGLHLVQFVKSKRFQMYDYKDPKVNQQEYGQANPVDIAAEYGRINIPVDIVAGRRDGVIPPACVKKHAQYMQDAGVDVSYKEFDYCHLEFSFTVQVDLVSYMLDCLER